MLAALAEIGQWVGIGAANRDDRFVPCRPSLDPALKSAQPAAPAARSSAISLAV